MKVVLLAGGLGTRLSEESHLRPKPMIEVGAKPVIWHVMKLYSHYGFNDFVICAGYKQQFIKEWFANYYLSNSDVTFDFTSQNSMRTHSNVVEPWRVTIVDTGHSTLTGGRIKRVRDYVGDEPFFMTYGDGVADVNISELLKFHQKSGGLATLTAIRPESRFGVLEVSGERVTAFREKSERDATLINGGFMVLEPRIFDYIEGDNTTFEREPLERLAKAGQLMCYKHDGFWQCMDTLRDKERLESLWQSGNPPWKVW